MKKIVLSLIVACFVTCFYSCYYDKADVINPNSNLCDTTIVSYANDVAPIIQGNCSSCHSSNVAANNGFGIVLDNYTDFKKNVDAGWLLPAVSWSQFPTSASVSVNMPLNLPKLGSCDVNKISAWIDQGEKNN